jgi:hypothetical protein
MIKLTLKPINKNDLIKLDQAEYTITVNISFLLPKSSSRKPGGQERSYSSGMMLDDLLPETSGFSTPVVKKISQLENPVADQLKPFYLNPVMIKENQTPGISGSLIT